MWLKLYYSLINNQMPDKPAKKTDKFFLITVSIIISLVILIVFTSWLLFFAPKDSFLAQLPGIKQTREFFPFFPEATPIPQPSPRPTRGPKPIGSGRTGFTVSGGKRDAPQFERSFLDPIDPEQGEEQKIIINAKNSTPINNISVIVKTDTTNTQLEMNLTSGDATSGTWEGSWVVDDTYLRNYQIEIIAEAANSIQQAEMVLR